MAATRTIAVTGASRGIGATIALELAARCYTVACLTRRGQGPEVAVPAELAPRAGVHKRQRRDGFCSLRATLYVGCVRQPTGPELQHTPAQRMVELLPLIDRGAGFVGDVGTEFVPVSFKRMQ